VHPLLIGPSLILRALDDLHAIAQAAASLEDIEQRINERLAAIVELGERLDERVDDILATGERVERSAKDVADVGRQVADALPVLQRAITMAEPLEGAVERLGRIVDRLPGGMRSRSGA
jgi:hypothetical protein